MMFQIDPLYLVMGRHAMVLDASPRKSRSEGDIEMTIRLKGLASMAVGAFICAMLVSCTGLGSSDELVTPSDESVTPSDEPVTLSDESVTQPGPNLVVWSPSVSNSAPAVGATFTVSATVRNDGNEASGATTMRFYRSTDATITTSDTEVGTAEVPALAPSGTSTQSLSLNAPSTPGTYYYGACVDTVTDESDTTNNCSSAVQVTVAELQEPDGLPRVRIYSTSGAVTEGMPARFRVTATPPPAANLEVKIAFAEVALTEDELILFYPPAEKTVTVNAGASSTTLTVDTIDDSDDDGNS